METVATAPAETGHALLIDRVFDAPPSLVFRLWSDPVRVKEWWHPENFETTRFDMDFRVGGSYRFNAVSTSSSHSAHGVYREIVAHERIVMTFEWESTGPYAGKETLITIDLVEVGDATEMTFHQSGFTSPASRDGHGEGWTSAFDGLAEQVVRARSTR